MIALAGDGAVCVQLMGFALNLDGCSGSHIKNHLEGVIYLHIYDWTVSLCGLVVRVLTWNVRGIRFDPYQGLFTFQSYCVV